MREALGRRPSRPTLASPPLAAAAAVVVLLFAAVTAHSIPRVKREDGADDGGDSSGEEDAVVQVCQNSMPCGWALYSQVSRTVRHFVRSTCECGQGRLCDRAEDDLSIRSFVYRCVELKAER